MLHQLVVREGGAVILKPAFELQASLRARARPITGCVDWEMLGHGRGKKVRTYAQVLRDAELGWTASCPSTQRVRAYLVKPHFTFAGQRGGVLAQLMRKVTSTPQVGTAGCLLWLAATQDLAHTVGWLGIPQLGELGECTG